MEKTRVMLIVLDGAGFDVLFSLAQKDVLPNFHTLLNNGCFNILNSTVPPFSPVAMPSLFTGKNPGKHGMFGFGRIENGVFKPYLSISMPQNTLWDILGHFDKKVILLNIPWTFPPFKVNGIMISGPPIPGNVAKSYPPELVKILESNIGQYLPDLNLYELNYDGLDEKRFLEEAYFVTKKRAEATYYLMENYEWDLFIAVFTTFDRMQHVYYGYFDEGSPLFDAVKRDRLIDYFKKVDEIIGKVHSLLNDRDYFLIASDHGFEYIHKYIGVNNLLIQGGLAKRRSNFQIFTLEKIINLLSKIGIKDIIKYVPRNMIQSATRIVPRDLDFARSKAFGVPAGYISINKNLINNTEEYANIKMALLNYLNSVRDIQNNDTIVEKIYDTREIYHGEFVKDAPELVIAYKIGYEPNLWRENIIENISIKKNVTVKTGTHVGLLAQRGIFIISGNGIKKKTNIEANIVDIFPTVLHILGIPNPRDIDGKILKDIFQPEIKFIEKELKYEEYTKDNNKDTYKITKKEEAKIIEKLKQLGYI